MKLEAYVQIALLPKILEAAHVLHDAGLIKEFPSDVVKRYVQAHPEINQALQRAGCASGGLNAD